MDATLNVDSFAQYTRNWIAYKERKDEEARLERIKIREKEKAEKMNQENQEIYYMRCENGIC